MPYLDCRTAVSTIERALVDALSLGLGRRHAEVADLAVLQAVTSLNAGTAAIPPGALRYVLTEGVVYKWQPLSNNAHALPYVIKPSDRSDTSRGRWERQQSVVTKGPNYFLPVHRVRTGYAKAVQLWQGNEGEQQAIETIFGQSPAILIRWTGDNLVTQGNQRALYEVNLSFEIWCFARNLRADANTLEGNALDEDSDEPGLWRMMGDVRYVLAGSDLGLEPGVRYIDIQGSGSILHEDLDERKFVGIVPITVRASYSIPDEDIAPIGEVWIQGRFVGMGYDISEDRSLIPRESFDAANYVAEGYQIFPVDGLNGAPTAGVAYINNQLVSSAPPPHLFTASKDTYRWLSAGGALFYAEVEPDAPVPAGPSGSMLIGVTRTDAANITNDTLLCGYALDSGEPYRVTPG